MLKISTVVPFFVTSDVRASPHITLYLCCSQAYNCFMDPLQFPMSLSVPSFSVLPFHLISITVVPLACSFPQFIKTVHIVQRYSKKEEETPIPPNPEILQLQKSAGKAKRQVTQTQSFLNVKGILNGLTFLVITGLSFALTPCRTASYLDYFVSEAFQWEYLDQ